MSICECDNAPEVMRVEFRRARKQYSCCECGVQIAAGETHEYTWGIWDSKNSTFRTCEKCSDLRDSMRAAGFCTTFGYLNDGHEEYLMFHK